MKIPEGKNIYFVSDIHLGMYPYDQSKDREIKLVRWLEEIRKDAFKIYLVGDIFDYWYEYKKVVPRGFTRFFGKIGEITDSGTEVIFFTGNHDYWMYNYLQEELGVTVYTKEQLVQFNDKKFYIAHGDGLGPGDGGFKFMKKLFLNKFLQWIFTRMHPNFTVWWGHTWSKNSRYSKGIEAEKFNGKDKELLYLHTENILQKEFFDVFIYGHRHIPIELEVGEKSKFIILGDWITHFSYAVFDGQKIELKYY